MLDVCTGTGVVALTAADKLSHGKVTAIDLSSGMLQQAKNKAVDKSLANIEFHQMDLDHLNFPKGSFDVATCSFGLFFVEDMTKGLSKIVSTVKPNAIDLSADLIAYACNCLENPAILSCVGCADKIDQTGLPRQHQRTASII